ncbi:MAG: hypothetical protein ACRDP1_17370 [Nocardioidaceae bacterium]
MTTLGVLALAASLTLALAFGNVYWLLALLGAAAMMVVGVREMFPRGRRSRPVPSYPATKDLEATRIIQVDVAVVAASRDGHRLDTVLDSINTLGAGLGNGHHGRGDQEETGARR